MQAHFFLHILIAFNLISYSAIALTGDVEKDTRQHLKSQYTRLQMNFTLIGLPAEFNIYTPIRLEASCEVNYENIFNSSKDHTRSVTSNKICAKIKVAEEGDFYLYVIRGSFKKGEMELQKSTKAPDERQKEALVRQAELLSQAIQDRAVAEFLKQMQVDQIKIRLNDNTSKEFSDGQLKNGLRIYTDPILELTFNLYSNGQIAYASVNDIIGKINRWKNEPEIKEILKGRSLRERIIALQGKK